MGPAGWVTAGDGGANHRVAALFAAAVLVLSLFATGYSLSVAALPPFDVVMVTDLTNPQETYQALLAVLDPSRVVGPSLLNLRARPLLVEDGDAEGKGEGEEAAP